MKVDTNSNSCTIIYASVMVVIAAFPLVLTSSSLKATQDKNVQLNAKKQILAALNIKNVEDADTRYQKYVKGNILMDVNDTLAENIGKFAISYRREMKEHRRLHVFVCDVNGQTKYAVPMYSAGLWGGIWGYVALSEGKGTVYGVYSLHANETPGLGVEIATDWFQHKSAGKKTLENDAVALGVVKNGKVEKAGYQMDGISGGAITSVGADAILRARLNNYISFLTK